MAEAYVYDFNDCIEVCASYNFWHDAANCTVAVYQPDAARPGNCWIGAFDVSGGVSSLSQSDGTDVALLQVANS